MYKGLNAQITLLCACRVRSVNLLKLFIEMQTIHRNASKYLTGQSALDNVSGTCRSRSRMAVRFITCPVFIIDNYVTRLVA